jgi:subtilisin family serine protease
MVVNMSIGSFVNKSSLNVVDIAVKNSVKAGVFYAIAAGNSFNFNGAWYVAEAKYWSPAHVIEATTVSSYDNSNIFNKNTLPLNEYVSFGSFVDILAPGYNVESTKLGGGITSMTGSSMATPHVTGAAALYLSKHYYSRNGSFKALTTPQQVLIALKSSALAPKTGFPNSAITLGIINSVGTPTLGVYTANH